jgi:hypothetical protein
MKKNRIIVISLTTLLLLTTLFIYRYSHINVKYPSAQQSIIEMDRSIQIGFFVLQAKTFEIITYEELSKRYLSLEWNPKEDRIVSTFDDVRIVLISLHVSNVGEEKNLFDPYSAISTLTWANGTDLYLADEINGDISIELDPGEEESYCIPFAIYKFHFLRDWDSILDQQFYLIFDLYPKKIAIKLQK